jgi:hypothetical protein
MSILQFNPGCVVCTFKGSVTRKIRGYVKSNIRKEMCKVPFRLSELVFGRVRLVSPFTVLKGETKRTRPNTNSLSLKGTLHISFLMLLFT